MLDAAPRPDLPERFLTIRDVAPLLRTSEWQAYQTVRRLGIGVRVGRRILVPAQALAELAAPAVERAKDSSGRAI